MKIQVYAATLEHRHGSNLYLAKSQEELEEKIHDYVRHEWDAELPGTVMPDDAKEAVERYFEDTNEFLIRFDPEELEL